MYPLRFFQFDSDFRTYGALLGMADVVTVRQRPDQLLAAIPPYSRPVLPLSVYSLKFLSLVCCHPLYEEPTRNPRETSRQSLGRFPAGAEDLQRRQRLTEVLVTFANGTLWSSLLKSWLRFGTQRPWAASEADASDDQTYER